ncbi:MAG: aspartate carbamoyltransferase [Candidatus Merdivicinus sp.]|jgi:aspartate carbamoyltransferase catalytic subunit
MFCPSSHHLIDLSDWPKEEWEALIQLALEIERDPRRFYGKMGGRILATLFYEPSTRTQNSFKSAMYRLGGQTLGFSNPQNSSVAKGETLADTIRMMNGYADIIAIRHPQEGAAKAAAAYSKCPVINAGDGGHLHPTQTLTDLVTLVREKGRLDNLTIGICGDLKYGRTVHSLIKALTKFSGNRFILISTAQLAVPAYVKNVLNSAGCPYQEVFSLTEVIGELDILYMTRIQAERFSSQQEYQEQKDVYVLDTEKMSLAKPGMKVLHPLPRVDEITPEVDEDPRAVYFKQAQYGVFTRMALILTLLEGRAPASPLFSGASCSSQCCSNPNCITNREPYLKKSFLESSGMLVCEYCEHKQLI